MPLWGQIVLIAIAAVGVIIALIAIFKNGGFKKLASYLEALDLIEEKIKEYMEMAEGMKELSGQEKKAFVIKQVEDFMAQQGLSIPIQEISNIIEKLIEFSKQINKRK